MKLQRGGEIFISLLIYLKCCEVHEPPSRLATGYNSCELQLPSCKNNPYNITNF